MSYVIYWSLLGILLGLAFWYSGSYFKTRPNEKIEQNFWSLQNEIMNFGLDDILDIDETGNLKQFEKFDQKLRSIDKETLPTNLKFLWRVMEAANFILFKPIPDLKNGTLKLAYNLSRLVKEDMGRLKNNTASLEKLNSYLFKRWEDCPLETSNTYLQLIEWARNHEAI